MAKISGLERLKMTLIAGLVQIFPPKRGLENLVFSGAEERTFDTQTVNIDIYDGKRGIAGYTARGVKGQTLGLEGWKTISITPPVIDEGFTVTAEDLRVRGFGADQFEKKGSLQKLKQIIRVNLRKLLARRQRAYSLQVAQLLDSGAVTVREFDDRGKALQARKIDFKMPTAHRYQVPVSWTDPKADIFAEFRKIDELTAKASGLKTTFVVVGSKALAGMVGNLQVKELLDNRRINFGELHKEEEKDGLTFWGTFSGKKIYTFDDWYDNGTGTLVPYIAEDRAYFGTPEAEVDIAYGSLSAMVNGMPTIMEARQLVDVKPDEDAIAVNHQVKSAKLYCLTQAGAFASVKVTF